MNSNEIRLLSKMKKLIYNGKCRFINRKDSTDYLSDLVELGITEDEAWQHILSLNSYFFYRDPKPEYYKRTGALIFKKQINGVIAYIKLKIEIYDDEEVICLSFHKDR